MKKKILITKNGFKLLKIIEGKCDGDKCEFKIIPEVESKYIDIFTLQLFSKSEEFLFDKDRELEITYHKSTLSKPTKIHLKLINKNDKSDIIYKTLPLTRLIDPDIHTEIPIPLLKIIIPNIINTKLDEKSEKDYKKFEIGDNNIIEIFMTQSETDVKDNIYPQKWLFLNMQLMLNPIQYWATGDNKFIGQNYAMQYYKREHYTHNICVQADVNDDIGIKINTMNCEGIDSDKLQFLFIENEFYLGFLAGTSIRNESETEFKLVYKKDIENDKYFDDKERKKWEYIFQKEIKKLNGFIKKNYYKYQQQFKTR